MSLFHLRFCWKHKKIYNKYSSCDTCYYQNLIGNLPPGPTTSYEHLYPGDQVVYKKKYYFVSTAHYEAQDGMQIVHLIRMADLESNRTVRKIITVRANECKIIYESKDPMAIEERKKKRWK